MPGVRWIQVVDFLSPNDFSFNQRLYSRASTAHLTLMCPLAVIVCQSGILIALQFVEREEQLAVEGEGDLARKFFSVFE